MIRYSHYSYISFKCPQQLSVAPPWALIKRARTMKPYPNHIRNKDFKSKETEGEWKAMSPKERGTCCSGEFLTLTH